MHVRTPYLSWNFIKNTSIRLTRSSKSEIWKSGPVIKRTRSHQSSHTTRFSSGKPSPRKMTGPGSFVKRNRIATTSHTQRYKIFLLSLFYSETTAVTREKYSSVRRPSAEYRTKKIWTIPRKNFELHSTVFGMMRESNGRTEKKQEFWGIHCRIITTVFSPVPGVCWRKTFNSGGKTITNANAKSVTCDEGGGDLIFTCYANVCLQVKFFKKLNFPLAIYVSFVLSLKKARAIDDMMFLLQFSRDGY